MFFDFGAIAAIAFIILLLKVKGNILKKLLGFDVILDILVTLMLMGMFAGTFSGMATAMAGGIAFSLALWLIKATKGYETLKRIPCNHCGHIQWKWMPQPAKFNLLRRAK